MKVKFIQKFETSGDFITLIYKIDGSSIKVNIGGTALSVFNMDKNEAGMLFVPAITDMYVKMQEQGALIEEVNIDSRGAIVEGKLIYSIDECEDSINKKR